MSQVMQMKLQKWGNSLALRVAGSLREIPNFEEGSDVEVEIFEDGFTVRKIKMIESTFAFPFSEADLLKNITPSSAHADALAAINLREITL